MSAGKVASWTAKVGQKVNAGEVFCEIETDKATVAYEAQEDAYLAKILVEAPSEVNATQCGKIFPFGKKTCKMVFSHEIQKMKKYLS